MWEKYFLTTGNGEGPGVSPTLLLYGPDVGNGQLNRTRFTNVVKKIMWSALINEKKARKILPEKIDNNKTVQTYKNTVQH